MDPNDPYFFMNYGYCALDKNNYPIFSHHFPLIYNKWKYQANLYFYILSLIDNPKGNILDIGCGQGGGVSIFNSYFNFNKIVGLDLNPPKNSPLYSNIEFISSNFLNNNLPSYSFDIITAVQTFEEFTSTPKTFTLFFKEISRLLKPQGSIIFTCFQLLNTDNHDLTSEIKSQNLYIDKEIDITKNVTYSIYIDSLRYKNNNKEMYNITRKIKEKLLHCSYKIYLLKSYGI